MSNYRQDVSMNLGPAQTGLTVYCQIYDDANNILVAASSLTVVESPAGYGNYVVSGGCELPYGTTGYAAFYDSNGNKYGVVPSQYNNQAADLLAAITDISGGSSPSTVAAAVIAALASASEAPSIAPGLSWVNTNSLAASSPSADFIIEQNSLSPVMEGYVALNGVGQQLSAATFRLWRPGSVTDTVDAPMTLNTANDVTTAAYSWQTGDTAQPGSYHYEIVATFAGQTISTGYVQKGKLQITGWSA